MDTIVLCKMFRSTDPLAENYRLLPLHSPQNGYRTWISSIQNLDQSCAWIKINCHQLFEVQNLSKKDIEMMTDFLDKQLAKIDLTRHDFNVNRIDYDYNVAVNEDEREALFDVLSGLPKRSMRMNMVEYPQSVYYMCKSRHFQIYDKVKERTDKGKQIKPWEADVLRQEVQCFSSHIRHMKQYHELLPTWDDWVDLDLQAYYLRNTKPIFLKGDFYLLNQALDIINSSNLGSAKKRNLCNDLKLIAVQGLDAMRESYSRNSYKDHLSCFEELGISPLTLPSKYKHIGKIGNPFFK